MLPLLAQDTLSVQLKGRVVDENQEPVSLCVVRVEGQATGTTANMDGQYSLSFRSADSVVILYSMFGYESRRRVLKKPQGKLTLNIVMHTASKENGMWDARISLGIGNVEFLSERIVTSDGEAFHYSGRQLDEMGKQRLAVKTPWQDVNDELALSTAFIDDIINGWSSKQAGMIYLALRQDTPKKDIAKLIGTSVQNVRNVLSSAKESLVRKYIERYRDIIMSHISQPTI